MKVLHLQALLPVWLHMDTFIELDEPAKKQLLLLSDLDYASANMIVQKMVKKPPLNPSAYVVSCVKHARRLFCDSDVGPCLAQAWCYYSSFVVRIIAGARSNGCVSDQRLRAAAAQKFFVVLVWCFLDSFTTPAHLPATQITNCTLY
jgi:hypothetical protein